MRECAHLMKTEQPRDLGYMQLAVIEVTNCQIAPKLLKYVSEVQPFVRKLSGQRPLAHSQTASNVFQEHSSMRKQRRDRVLNSCAVGTESKSCSEFRAEEVPLLIVDPPGQGQLPPWQRRTNVWLRVTSPARRAKRLRYHDECRNHSRTLPAAPDYDPVRWRVGTCEWGVLLLWQQRIGAPYGNRADRKRPRWKRRVPRTLQGIRLVSRRLGSGACRSSA